MKFNSSSIDFKMGYLSENLFCFGKTLIANFINLFCKNRNEIEECKKKLIKFIQDFK